MDFSNQSHQQFLNGFTHVVKSERKITHIVLCYINEAEKRKLYAELGYESLYKFLVGYLKYSSDAAYDRISAAKVLLKVPEVTRKLEEGSITLTQLKQVQKCIQQERVTGNQINESRASKILEAIENKSTFDTKKILAVEFNQPVQMHEVLKPQQDNSIRLEITLSEEDFKALKEAKDLLSHALPNATWAEVYVHLAKKQITKVKGKERSSSIKGTKNTFKNKDNYEGPGLGKDKDTGMDMDKNKDKNKNSDNGNWKEKGNTKFKNSAEDAKRSSINPTLATSSTQSLRNTRKPLTITTRRKILAKANRSCEYKDPLTGRRCEGHYQLEVDHIVPLACGGTNAPENLRVLCRTHNQHMARKWGLKTKPLAVMPMK